jgi:hypothetical protein
MVPLADWYIDNLTNSYIGSRNTVNEYLIISGTIAPACWRTSEDNRSGSGAYASKFSLSDIAGLGVVCDGRTW